MIFDVQFGDKYTINSRGALYQYRGGNARLLGDPEWFFSGPCDNERDLPYTLFKQVAEAAGHTIEERTVCYRDKEDDVSWLDRYRVWPDGSWCHVRKNGTEDERTDSPFCLTDDYVRCEDAPPPPTPAPQPAPKTLTVWASQHVYNKYFVLLYTSEQQAREMSAKGTPIYRVEMPIAEAKENNRE